MKLRATPTTYGRIAMVDAATSSGARFTVSAPLAVSQAMAAR